MNERLGEVVELAATVAALAALSALWLAATPDQVNAENDLEGNQAELSSAVRIAGFAMTGGQEP